MPIQLSETQRNQRQREYLKEARDKIQIISKKYKLNRLSSVHNVTEKK